MLRLTFAATVLGSFVAILNAQTPTPKVKTITVWEIRGTDQCPAGISSHPPSPGLTVTLRVDGLDQPARHGTVIISEAKDDAGTDLKPRPGSGGGDEATEFPAVPHRPDPDASQETPGFYAQLKLQLPARQARRISSLKGELRLVAGGKPATVKVPGVKALCGKTVDHPDLARSGVTVQVGQPSQGDPLEFAAMISGLTPRDTSVSVADADGKDITHGSSGSIGKAVVQWHMDLDRPLRDTDVLTVHLFAGQKPLTVPFDLKEIALP
jgi:hypothetical protein